MSSHPSRQEAINLARAEVARMPVYLDTETTGLAATDQIVEICVLNHDGQVLVDSLVKPLGRIPVSAASIHGITDDMVKDAPTWAELWPAVESILSAQRIAIYNSEFDIRLMQQSHRRHGIKWRVPATQFLCIMQLYARYFGQWDSRRASYRWHSLESAGRQCRIALPNAHRARPDAVLARALMRYMAESR
jgi:DNA polymerase III subunit epsilon